MRKLYNEFFYIPKHGKVREKVMLTRMASTITTVLACLLAMAITAYAYFSYNVTSSDNVIKAATFTTEVQVRLFNSEGEIVDRLIPITSDDKFFEIEGLEIGEIYTITIEPIQDETSAQTGFVIVTADDCPDTYHTQQLGRDENAAGGETEELTFRLMITDRTTLYLEAHWGTSSYYDDYRDKGDDEEFYITQDEEITMIVNGFTEPNIEQESDPDETDDAADEMQDSELIEPEDETESELIEPEDVTEPELIEPEDVPEPEPIEPEDTTEPTETDS